MTPLHTRVVEAMARALCKRTGNDPDEPIADNGMPCWAAYVPEAQAALTAAVSALAAEGWGVRPDVATEGMNLAAIENGYVDEVYPLMIAAAPSPWEDEEP